LLRISTTESQRNAAQVIPLPSDLGPLRSVQSISPDRSDLLIGAQLGVLLVDPENPSAATRYRDVGVTSALGFNSAAVAGNILWASHSEAGVVAWQLDAPDQPLRTI